MQHILPGTIRQLRYHTCDACLNKSLSPKTQTLKSAVIKPNVYVYLIQCGEFYKIGITKNIAMRSWSTDNPYDIEIIKTWASQSARKTEGRMHAHFRQYHHRGEWFKLPDDAVEWLMYQSDIDTVFAETSQEAF